MLEPFEAEVVDVGVLVPEDVFRRFASLRQGPNSAASTFVDCAEGFVGFGMLLEAVDAYSVAIERDSGCVAALIGRGQAVYNLALLEDGEVERKKLAQESASDFKRALELDGSSHKAVLGVGSALLLINRFAECSLWIEERLRLTPDRYEQGDLLYLFSLCRLFAGDPIESGECADKMEQIAGYDVERSFIHGLISCLDERAELVADWRVAVGRRDEKLAGVLAAIEGGQKCGTFLDLARLLLYRSP